MIFFIVSQIVAKLQFHQRPGNSIFIGGALIVSGGIVMTFWKRNVEGCSGFQTMFAAFNTPCSYYEGDPMQAAVCAASEHSY